MYERLKQRATLFLMSHPALQPLLYKAAHIYKAFFTARSLACDADRSEEFLFIVGCGRSGNTLLRKLLMQHYDIYIPPETYVLSRQITQSTMNGGAPWVEQVDMVLSMLENHPEFDTFGVADLNEYKKMAKQWSLEERSIFNLIFHFYKWLGEKNGCSSAWVGDKTPVNTLGLGVLNKAFPNSKFVYLERDPVDVVQSYVASGIYPTARAAAQRWRISVDAWKRFRKLKSEADVLELKYEHLVSNPEGALSEIGERFLLPKRKEPLDLSTVNLGDVWSRAHHGNVKNAPNTSSVGKGRSSICEQDLKEIRQLLGRLPKERGYRSL